MKFEIPMPMKTEHDELHADLVAATKAGGQTGDAAKAVAKVLHNHFRQGGGIRAAAARPAGRAFRREIRREWPKFQADGQARGRAADHAFGT